MRVPLFTPADDPAVKKVFSKRWASLFELECFGPCHRHVKICLSALFFLTLLVICLYLDIVAVLFWDSLLRHSPDRALPLRTIGRKGQLAGTTQNLEAAEFLNRDERSQRLRRVLDESLKHWLKGLPSNVGEDWCQRMTQEDGLSVEEGQQLANWKVDQSMARLLPDPKQVPAAELPEAGCNNLRQFFPFPDEPGSKEEKNFPLAYGILVHKSPIQVFFLLSAIYQPQNAYCLAVDDRADEEFKKQMNLLMDCFPNIFVMGVGKVEWCQFGVVRGVYSCLRYLSELNHDWRYYQYLSGVDLPLKTNLEMVRIFKQLNKTVNVEILPFETSRVRGDQVFMKSPLTLWKSSLSALLSRDAVNTMVRSNKVRQLLNYLQFGICSDEALWGTIAGNPKELKIPGGFDANYLYGRLFKETYLSEIKQRQKLQLQQQQEQRQQNEPTLTSSTTSSSIITATNATSQQMKEYEQAEPFKLSTYYISRFQVWNSINPMSGSKESKCGGKFVSSSCVYGIDDLPRLLRRPELIAHKLYLDFQPAAYFCLWKQIHERSLDWKRQEKFEGKTYSQLPIVKMARRSPEDELRFFFN